MAIRVVRLGSPRVEGEGNRVETMKLGQDAKTTAQWARFIKKYRAEMATPENSHAIELLAVLSHQCNFSVGCYCENEAHCHRSVLRELLAERAAKLEPSEP